jgi:dihydroflavonol-4-reductase
MRNVLLTGANGFVGSNLAEMLVARGDRVTCLVRRRARAERLQSLDCEIAHWRGLDDLDAIRRAVAGRDVVYHVAGATKAVRKAALFRINEQGTQNVVRVCAEQPNPPVLVYVSSLAAAGPSSADRPRVETDPPRPVCYYGHSKRAAELALRRHADRVPITIVRPPIILGPADREGLAMFRPVRRFRAHVMPGGGRQRYSLIHVGDLCELLILAAERGRRIETEETDADARAKGCYFAACREYPTYAELGRMLRDAVGRRVVMRVPVPMVGVRAVAVVVETISRVIRRPLYLNLDKAREIAAGSWTCSPQAAIDQLGFAPNVPLAQRLRETAAWYRAVGWL